MAAAAQKVEASEGSSRRFQIPDLNRHGNWLIDRLVKLYPHRSAQDLAGWLRGLIYTNDYLFLYREHGVALATLSRVHPLLPQAHVQEIFVLSEPGHEEEAAGFYDDFVRWAKQMSIEVIVVQEMSDVPHEVIKARLGRLFTRTVTFARV